MFTICNECNMYVACKYVSHIQGLEDVNTLYVCIKSQHKPLSVDRLPSSAECQAFRGEGELFRNNNSEFNILSLFYF